MIRGATNCRADATSAAYCRHEVNTFPVRCRYQPRISCRKVFTMHATTVTVRPFGSPQAMTLDLAARYQHFQQVPDLRHRRGVRYPLAVLLTIALWARVTGRWGRVTTRSPGLVPVIAAAGHLHAQARTTPSCGASSVTACSITARPAASPGCWPQAARQCFFGHR